MKQALTFPRLVEPEPVAEPDYSYEYRERQRIHERFADGRVHIAGDRRKPIWLPERVMRLWR